MAAVIIIFSLIFSSPAVAMAAAEETTSSMTDDVALLLLKESFTNTSALSSWSVTGGSPCDIERPWTGVICYRGIVTGLRLAGMGLGGTVDVDALAHFRGLRSVSLENNRLSGPIPDFGKLTALKSLYISENYFSGEIPDAMFSKMTHLKKLWLSRNSFSGSVPSSLSAVKSLIELHLEGNNFSGTLPDLDLPSLTSFDCSWNDLSGSVPPGLSRFGPESFQGNSGLCGTPLNTKHCAEAPPPAHSVAEAAPLAEDAGNGSLMVVLVLLAVVAASAIVAMALVMAMQLKRKEKEKELDAIGAKRSEPAVVMEPAKVDGGDGSAKGSSGKRDVVDGIGVAGVSIEQRQNGTTKGVAGGEQGELVMVNEEKGAFGLLDLMKAAAEVLGCSGLGSAYKAALASGVTVVVKRLRELNKVVERDAFDREIRRLGALRHPNILPLLAYHFRRDEKLIIYEYVPKGSLLYLLHGRRRADGAGLDWATRMKMARGIARGMAYLHSELSLVELPHGNLKSSNVLVGADYQPLLVDYGLSALANPSAAAHLLFAYNSPEALQLRKVSRKSDVYCLGILILELLTGKYPSQYPNNPKEGADVAQWAASAMAERREAELLDPDILSADRTVLPHMEQLFRIAAACAEPSPDLRPDMQKAAAMIEEIAIAAGLADDDAAECSATALVRSLSRAESHGERSSRRNKGDCSLPTSSSVM